MEQETLVLIKPDGVARGLVGEIISRFERAGLQITGLKLVKATEEQADAHYILSDEWVKSLAAKTRESYAKRGIELKETDYEIAKKVQTNLKRMLLAGPIVAMVVKGNCAIEIVRKLVGSTEPKSAAAGTIRGDYSTDSYDLADSEERAIWNLVHASSSEEEAKREIAVWFQKVFYY
ncbi:MAG: nucleoside-diphosphate kinase [Candidatus Nanoarchaeia archaeon]